jgi:glycine cleavage system H protein
MNFPENVKYTNDHEWIRQEGGETFAGITDYAQTELGDMIFVDVPTVGETLEQNAVFGAVEAVKTVSDLLMPVAGTVLAVNEALEEHPELINDDPYGAGWIIKIAPAAGAAADKNLLDAAQYRALIAK